jgi:hypothetical protein
VYALKKSEGVDKRNLAGLGQGMMEESKQSRKNEITE